MTEDVFLKADISAKQVEAPNAEAERASRTDLAQMLGLAVEARYLRWRPSLKAVWPMHFVLQEMHAGVCQGLPRRSSF